jgi:hypothetical protein
MTDLQTATAKYINSPEVQFKLTNAIRHNDRDLITGLVEFAFQDGFERGAQAANQHAAKTFDEVMGLTPEALAADAA